MATVMRTFMDESQVRAALFEWLEKESGRNGWIFTKKQLEDRLSAEAPAIGLIMVNLQKILPSY